FIDTLSFEIFAEGPWPAYGQFCRHFFAPLFLMARVDLRLGKLMQNYIDGVPLDLAATLLRGKGGFAAWQHIRLHAAAVRRFADAGNATKSGAKSGWEPVKIKKETLAAIIESLIRSIETLKPREKITEWGDYYRGTNYSEDAAAQKAALVGEFLRDSAPFSMVWDMGANDGRYSRLALEHGAQVVAFDIDPTAVSRNYRAVHTSGEALLPLVLDLTAPSPGIGFANRERKTITGRKTPDVTLMLAVIHHLVISNNLPLDMIAAYLASFTRFLIIEFVPKGDSQVQRLLKTRADIFPDYTEECFETALRAHFTLLRKERIPNTERTLYLFRKSEE
ncbi:MAG: class I SAM-dependent methyltransferase, partial [Treponema sp.]|nr:class I SAM-dependent methyltransferase [Treponema sp.]